MIRLEDKVVYITGGSSGIGLETARLFASLGAHVAVFARNPERLEQARLDIELHRRSLSQKVFSLSMDVADHEDVDHKMASAMKDFGIPDILIANAGVGYADRFMNIPFEEFAAIMKTNVFGVRNTIAALLPSMKDRGGHIVIVSSAAGLMGMYGYTAYGTSKYALVGFAECLRSELKPLGIPVTLVCPAEVDTPFVPREAQTLPPESRAVKSFCGLIKPDRVARAIVRGVSKRKFLVIPGMLTNIMYVSHRLTGGVLTRATSDLVVRFVQWRLRR